MDNTKMSYGQYQNELLDIALKYTPFDKMLGDQQSPK